MLASGLKHQSRTILSASIAKIPNSIALTKTKCRSDFIQIFLTKEQLKKKNLIPIDYRYIDNIFQE